MAQKQSRREHLARYFACRRRESFSCRGWNPTSFQFGYAARSVEGASSIEIDGPPARELELMRWQHTHVPHGWPAAERGEMLIQLVRSRIGARPATRRLFRTLRLAKIGHARVFDGSERSVRAIMRELDPWVRVSPLTLPAAQRLEELGGHSWPAVSVAIERDKYESAGTRGVSVDLGTKASRDYLRLEHNERGLALAWSTALPLPTALDAFFRALGGSHGLQEARAEVDDWSVGRRRHGDVSTLLADVHRYWRPYPTATINTSAVIFAWRTPSYPRHVQERVLAGDMRLLLKRDKTSSGFARKLVARTATPRLASGMEGQLGELIEEFAREVFERSEGGRKSKPKGAKE